MPKPEYTPATVRSFPFETISAATGRSVRRTDTIAAVLAALHTDHPEGGTFTVLDRTGVVAATIIMPDRRTPDQRDADDTDEEEPAALGS